MSKNKEKKSQYQSKGVNNIKIDLSPQQAQIQQQYVHLQSVLILTQLNSAYYKMQLTSVKNFTTIENKYYSLKITAFLRMANYKPHFYEVKTKIDYSGGETPETKSVLFGSVFVYQPSLSCKLINKQSMIPIQTISDATNKAFIRSKIILKNLAKMIQNKMKNVKSLSFHYLIKNSSDSSTINMVSDKSSKIQTIDSQKSKIFKRSVDKESGRKSFSLQKSIRSNKKQYYVPIKYQAQTKNSTPLLFSNQTSIVQESKVEAGYVSDFTKFLQKNHEPITQRRNLLSANRQRKVLKSSSNKQLNVTGLVYAKQQKIRQLEYLQGKYKKLITYFNWFSQRFLKVIDQEVI